METANKPNQKKKIIIAVIALAVVVAVLTGLYLAFGPKGQAGDKTIHVQVVFADKTTKEYTYRTDAEFLREVLEENGLIAGEESAYGMFVKTVAGVTVDDSKQEWWCFTKGGASISTGVDQTPIADGDQFEITLTVGY